MKKTKVSKEGGPWRAKRDSGVDNLEDDEVGKERKESAPKEEEEGEEQKKDASKLQMPK